MRVTIVGPGNMGRALTTRLVAGSHDVTLVGTSVQRTEAVAAELREGAAGPGSIQANDAVTAAGRCDVLILALPYQEALESVQELGDLLRDKIVVDITNPLNEDYSGLVTGEQSAAERIRSLLPEDTRLVKAFNTTFARTLVGGSVSGQPLDVFIAGDDSQANETVAELARSGRLRPIVVGGLERAKQLEALGFLGISLQEPLGTGFMTGWKLVFPGSSASGDVSFPRNAVVGVLPDTASSGTIVTEVAAVGVSADDVQMVMGAEGAAALRNARQSRTGLLGSLFGYETEHTLRHLREVEAGNVVFVVGVDNEALGTRVGEILSRHGARFINYYSRWTARSLLD